MLDELASSGLIEHDGDTWRTTRRWQGAMARSALRLYQQGDDGEDLRVPIARALVDVYGSSLSDDRLAELVLAMLPIEARALGASGPMPPAPGRPPP